MICGNCHTIYPPDEGSFCARDGGQLTPSDRIFAGKYVLEERLGFGQMGDVYRATQSGVGRKVALKILRADQADNTEMVKRFEREAQIASSIDHPNAVTIYESGRSAEGQAYIAMEYLVGETLGRLMERECPLGLPRALDLLLPVVRAVAAAHSRSIVHRDIKPDNIFIARKQLDTAVDEVVKVLDFGIARVLGTGVRLTATHSKLGTPQYMSPEQLQGEEASPQSDVFALALLLTEMLTGRLPWGETSRSSLTSMMARVVSPPRKLHQLRPNIECPSELQDLLDLMLAQQPSRRPADAGVVLRRLLQIQAGLTQRVTPISVSAQTPLTPLPDALMSMSPTISGIVGSSSVQNLINPSYQHLPGVQTPQPGSVPLVATSSGIVNFAPGQHAAPVVLSSTPPEGAQPLQPLLPMLPLSASATTLPPRRPISDSTVVRDPRLTRRLPRPRPRWLVPLGVMLAAMALTASWLFLGGTRGGFTGAGVTGPSVAGLSPSGAQRPALPRLLLHDPTPTDEPPPAGFSAPPPQALPTAPPEPPEPRRRHRRHRSDEPTEGEPTGRRHHRSRRDRAAQALPDKP
ncbi:MAG: serine/threonine-protein kinase [Polyangia bacterium]